jgi:hypothetical protein
MSTLMIQTRLPETHPGPDGTNNGSVPRSSDAGDVDEQCAEPDSLSVEVGICPVMEIAVEDIAMIQAQGHGIPVNTDLLSKDDVCRDIADWAATIDVVEDSTAHRDVRDFQHDIASSDHDMSRSTALSCFFS